MRNLSQAQLRILVSAMPALTERVLGLSEDALREAMHPVWVQTITDILHEGGECPCQHGGTCFVQLLPHVQLERFAPEGDLSLDAFIVRYEEACRQALGSTHTQ